MFDMILEYVNQDSLWTDWRQSLDDNGKSMNRRSVDIAGLVLNFVNSANMIETGPVYSQNIKTSARTTWHW